MLWPRFWSISTCKDNPKQLENSLNNILNMVKILKVWKKYTRLYIQSSKAYGMCFLIPLSLKYLQRLSFRNAWLSSKKYFKSKGCLPFADKKGPKPKCFQPFGKDKCDFSLFIFLSSFCFFSLSFPLVISPFYPFPLQLLHLQTGRMDVIIILT